MYFFDTYALWEILKGNPNYEKYSSKKMICTIFNLYEFYSTLRRDFSEETARSHVSILADSIVEATAQDVIEAVEMKKRLNRKNLSFIDCLGYVKAKELGIKFLTGDKEFAQMENVEFVK